MPGHSDEIRHWQDLLTQHRRNVQRLRKQLAVFGKGMEPLHILNQLEAEEGEIRKAKSALRKLGESPELLPGDPDEVTTLPSPASPVLPEPTITVPTPPSSAPSLPETPLPGTLPQISASPHIPLTAQERVLLQYIHQGSSRVLVEKEFGGGYGGTRVLLTLPSTADGTPAARKVSKLGFALELHRERDNYQLVKAFLPFCVAPVEECYAQGDQAALNYIWVGGGALGQVMDLEEYYRAKSVEQIIKTLQNLLDKELGQRWYSKAAPESCLFAAEYGQHMVEHLRLELRPASSDGFWLAACTPAETTGYLPIDLEAIRQERDAIQPKTLVLVEGLVVARIKRSEVKLQDPGGEGIVVRVEFDPASNAAQKLKVGDRVGVRGQVVYNRRGRMEQIVCQAFPSLSTEVGSDSIELPGAPMVYPNPLKIYSQILGKTLEGRQSYIHGDLHLRNVLVDEVGKGWLIDFAKVGKAHNLYDFIKLETYVRLMQLADDATAFSLDDYKRFEEALNDATLTKSDRKLPDNEHLNKAYQVILGIRNMARKYMGPEPDFRNEYFPSLFLYCLAVIKYYQKDSPQPTRLAFATACALGRRILEQNDVQATILPGEQPGLAELLEKLDRHFNESELREVCFTLRIDYKNIKGKTKKDMARELILYFDRRERLGELVSTCRKLRPHVSW